MFLRSVFILFCAVKLKAEETVSIEKNNTKVWNFLKAVDFISTRPKKKYCIF